MVVEAGRRQGWEPLLGPFSGAVTIETFGHSAPADDLAREYGFTRENVVSEALRALEAFKTSGPEFLARTAAALDRAGA